MPEQFSIFLSIMDKPFWIPLAIVIYGKCPPPNILTNLDVPSKFFFFFFKSIWISTTSSENIKAIGRTSMEMLSKFISFTKSICTISKRLFCCYYFHRNVLQWESNIKLLRNFDSFLSFFSISLDTIFFLFFFFHHC